MYKLFVLDLFSSWFNCSILKKKRIFVKIIIDSLSGSLEKHFIIDFMAEICLVIKLFKI